MEQGSPTSTSSSQVSKSFLLFVLQEVHWPRLWTLLLSLIIVSRISFSTLDWRGKGEKGEQEEGEEE